jgi:PAS domain S-box-containing protein
MVDALPLMAWTAKPDGALDYLNSRWYQYTGQTPKEALGSGWASTMPPDTEEAVFTRWHHSLKHKVPYEVECKYRRHDGEYRWHIARAEPIKNEAGEVLYWLGTSTDIHDQKTLSALLEKKVQERTSELLNTNVALKRSNEDLEQFASVASHDLKEPLRKIQFFSDMLQDNRTKNPEGAIRKIKEASNRMVNLIEDLLEFSSLRRTEEQFQLVDLNQVLETIKQDLELVIKEKDVKLLAAQLPTLKGIPHQLEQLFNNLIGNAIKYSKTSEAPKIVISAKPTSKEDLIHLPAMDSKKSYTTITFADNGIGFHAEEAERIFGIFERLHSRDTYTGTGVGLALCRKVVHNHGGEIYATSQPGIGSSFVVILPV